MKTKIKILYVVPVCMIFISGCTAGDRIDTMARDSGSTEESLEVVAMDEPDPIVFETPHDQLVRSIECLSDSNIQYDRGAGPVNVSIIMSTEDGNFYSSPDECAVTPQWGKTTLDFKADFSYSFYAEGPYNSTEPVPVTGLLIEYAEILSVLYIEMRGDQPFQYSLHGSEHIIDAIEEDGKYVAKAESESIILYDAVEVTLTRLSAVISTGQEVSFGNITREVELIFAPA